MKKLTKKGKILTGTIAALVVIGAIGASLYIKHDNEVKAQAAYNAKIAKQMNVINTKFTSFNKEKDNTKKLEKLTALEGNYASYKSKDSKDSNILDLYRTKLAKSIHYFTNDNDEILKVNTLKPDAIAKANKDQLTKLTTALNALKSNANGKQKNAVYGKNFNAKGSKELSQLTTNVDKTIKAYADQIKKIDDAAAKAKAEAEKKAAEAKAAQDKANQIAAANAQANANAANGNANGGASANTGAQTGYGAANSNNQSSYQAPAGNANSSSQYNGNAASSSSQQSGASSSSNSTQWWSTPVNGDTGVHGRNTTTRNPDGSLTFDTVNDNGESSSFGVTFH